MPEERQYEYRTLTVTMTDARKDQIAEKLNNAAADGWILDNRYDHDGTTLKYVLRRPE